MRRPVQTGSPCVFDIECHRCERLAGFLTEVRERYPDYHARPVGPFGDLRARLLIVGLAPGMHGANRTGRPFTGDHAGLLLYRTLFEVGLASRAQSDSSDDGLELIDCRITNAVKCLPPANKPTAVEVKNCSTYLEAEISWLPHGGVILALGGLAHGAVLRALGKKLRAYPFGHGHEHQPEDGLRLVDSYHCSRYNTQTGRLTEAMFRVVVERAASLIGASEALKIKSHKLNI